MAEFFLGSPRLAKMPNRVSKDDTDGGYTFKGRLSSMESNGPPGPKGVYASLLPSPTKCPRSNEIPPYGSGENFLVIGLILPSLPTVAKGFVSQDAGSTLCVPLSAFWSLSCSLSVHGQRESGSSTRRPSCHRLGNHLVLYPLVFATFAQLMMGAKWYPAPTFKPATCAKVQTTPLPYSGGGICRSLGVLDDDANNVHGHTSRAKDRPRVLVVRQICL